MVGRYNSRSVVFLLKADNRKTWSRALVESSAVNHRVATPPPPPPSPPPSPPPPTTTNREVVKTSLAMLDDSCVQQSHPGMTILGMTKTSLVRKTKSSSGVKSAVD
ncbi:hypothetical protein M0802_012220 [Mischocyttarus mexicanus]|nr:hypothetical protein M0802_012220 [Mischocyttarus mexicanus]